MMRPAIWSGGRPVYCQITPITGIRISGKISTGVRSADSGPMIRRSSASTTNVYGRLRAIRTSSVMARTFPDLTYRTIMMMQRGIYLKYRQIANCAPLKSLQFHETFATLRKASCRKRACLRLTHQVKRIRKETGAAEIARFQGKNHLAFRGANGAQYRHPCRDFCADEETGNAQTIDDRARSFTTGNHQTPHAGLHEAFGNIGHGLLDGMPGCITAMTGLQSCNLIRRRAGGDQNRPFRDSLSRPGERAARPALARHDLLGIEMKQRHLGLGAGDLLQGSLRTAAGQTRCRSADWRLFRLVGGALRDPARSDQRTRQTKSHAGGANRQPVVERYLTNRLKIAIEDRIDNGGASSIASELSEA